MSLGRAIEELRKRNERVPRPLRLPTPHEVAQVERELGVTLHPDFRRYLLEASDVVVGTLEPATITRPESHTHLPALCASAREVGVPTELVPLCEDNGDFFCMNRDGEVVFWSHDGPTQESWPDLATWIEEVWLGQSV